MKLPSLNVLGQLLEPCSTKPRTGFFRDGCCNTGPEDTGQHTVCATMTAEFLALSKYLGNDLSTPQLDIGFPGLKPGDQWCLCAARFLQAHEEGAAPRVRLEATHQATAATSCPRLLAPASPTPDSPTTGREADECCPWLGFPELTGTTT